MNQEQRREICLYRIERANETFEESKTLFEKGMMGGSVNRLYYSLFYSVTALALSYDFTTSKHTGLRGWFNLHIVKEGIISIELGDLYNNLYDMRTNGDYKDLIQFDPQVVEEIMKIADQFLSLVNRLTIQRLDAIN